MTWQAVKWLIAALLSAFSFARHESAIAASTLLNPSETLNASDAVGIEWNLKIPLRDGVRLSATRYVPKAQNVVPLCVVSLTPYIADHYHARGVYFAGHGIVFVIVDVRGRGESEGQFTPFLQEAKDGYDVVEWLAKQPYCHDAVAMWGGSYGGYTQWAAAKELPRHLVSIVPASAPYLGVDFPMQKNIFALFDIRWLTYIEGHASHPEIYSDDSFWNSTYWRWLKSGQPFRELDSFAGVPSSVFQTWVSHPSVDAYWDSFSPTSSQYAQVDIPILTITGAYDDDQLGALTYYRRHLGSASKNRLAPHFLVIGPWDHLGTRSPRQEFDGARFGSASLIDLPKLHVDWYNWIVHRGPQPMFLHDKVSYYEAGVEKWRYAPSLEAVTAETKPYFLDSAANAVDVFYSGVIRPKSRGRGDPDHYLHDPNDIPSATLRDSNDTASLTSQREIFSNAVQRLIYHTEPLDRDTNISGFFRLSAWISIDQPDADFAVSVYALNPDGTSLLLSSDTLRARYRETPRSPSFAASHEPRRYDFEGFNFVSRQLRRGTRLRLTVGPVDAITVERNYSSGGIVAEESAKDSRAVTVRVFHDAAHPSALYIPFGWPDSEI